MSSEKWKKLEGIEADILDILRRNAEYHLSTHSIRSKLLAEKNIHLTWITLNGRLLALKEVGQIDGIEQKSEHNVLHVWKIKGEIRNGEPTTIATDTTAKV